MVVRAATPGRVRLDVPGLKWNEAFARRLAATLRERKGVRDVEPSLATGRVLIHFDPRKTTRAAVEEAVSKLVPKRPRGAAARRVAWHSLPVDEALERVGATREGLDAAEARERLRRTGANRVRDVKARSSSELLLEQVGSRPALLLLGAAGLSLAIGDFLEAGALALAVGTNVSIGFVTERRAEELIRGFSPSSPRNARVRRREGVAAVPLATLVPGDVLLLRAGDFVAADARILEAHDLQVDESSLTGETFPVSKGTASSRKKAPLAERTGMVFRGTVVLSGEGEAVVVGTGDATEMGRIARLIRQAEPPETPLETELDHLSRRIELLGLGATAAVGLLGLLRGRPIGRVVRSAIALGVAAIPEGLPATATTALALSMRRLRSHGIVIRRLAAAETLGSTTVICCDKTGTLTLNQMRVEELWAPDDAARSWLLAVLALSNDVRREGGQLVGSPTERALIERAAADLDVQELARAHEKIATRPRRPGVARAITVHRWSGDGAEGGLVALAKGSPDAIRELLADPELGPELERRNAELADRGLRVLAAAWRRLPEDHDEADLESGFELAGLVALGDPLRPDAAETIARARKAGMRAVILTGDQLETARAVAKACGLATGPRSVVEASELDRLDRAAWREIDVVARASPEDKLRVVEALQDAGHVVAMAGDGVNDAVALRAADVGVALAARTQALPVALADVILATESMEGILDAVAEGRALRDNIRRAAQYLIATNASEIAIMLSAAVLGLEDPLTPLQLLWINLLGDTAPALALALEPVEADVLTRPPIGRGSRLISNRARIELAFEALLLAGSGLAVYGGTVLRGAGHARARSAASAAIMAGQLLHSMRHRARRDRWPSRTLAGATAAGLAIEAATLLVPPLRRVTGATSLSLLDLATAAVGAILPQVVLAGVDLLRSPKSKGEAP